VDDKKKKKKKRKGNPWRINLTMVQREKQLEACLAAQMLQKD